MDVGWLEVQYLFGDGCGKWESLQTTIVPTRRSDANIPSAFISK